MKSLSKDEMKKILGGLGGGSECSISQDCPNGGSVSCRSNGAAGNAQGGESCQKTPSLVTCYDIGAPNNWNAQLC